MVDGRPVAITSRRTLCADAIRDRVMSRTGGGEVSEGGAGSVWSGVTSGLGGGWLWVWRRRAPPPPAVSRRRRLQALRCPRDKPRQHHLNRVRHMFYVSLLRIRDRHLFIIQCSLQLYTFLQTDKSSSYERLHRYICI